MKCQYALATISFLSLCYTNEKEFMKNYAEEMQTATRWWIAAAKQGHFFAIDNLCVCGVGAEAEQVRAAAKELEKEQPELVGSMGNMPVYRIDFMQLLCKKVYGRVAANLIKNDD